MDSKILSNASDRELLEMALDALEDCTTDKNGDCVHCGELMQCKTGCQSFLAREALRAALAAPEAEPVAHSKYGGPELQALVLEKLIAPVERKPLTDAQIEEMRGEANRGYNIENDDYFKAVRDAEAAHHIKAAA